MPPPGGGKAPNDVRINADDLDFSFFVTVLPVAVVSVVVMSFGHI